MPCTRHLIICEGESERAYLQRLQAFFEQQPLPGGHFEPPLRIFSPQNAVARSGTFSALQKLHRTIRAENKKASSIHIWTDFDLYLRNDNACADLYRRKSASLPDFLFSFHNFEDFLALHLAEEPFSRWVDIGRNGHFQCPLRSAEYLQDFAAVIPGYRKGTLPPDFISWEALANLQRHRIHQPIPNPAPFDGIGRFADFLVTEIERAYPGRLAPL
jgi:hypothetical protein